MALDRDRERIVIDGVKPEVDGGRFPIKRTVGEKVVVEADVFADGHDELSCLLLHRKEEAQTWTEVPMEALVNDRWRGEFRVRELGRYRYTIEAWVDRFQTWRRDLEKKFDAGQEVSVDLLVGAQLLREVSERADSGKDGEQFQAWSKTLGRKRSPARRVELALSEGVASLMAKYPDRRSATTYPRELAVMVDREKARFSAWYEMFPRSCSPKPGQHGTFRDCDRRNAGPTA